MKVSVIIPVYGVEKYLDKCISSAVSQTFKDLEIILVDDGGTDNCPQICDSWAERDSRITVIHKENGGQGSARNAALSVCTGRYILFVDGDDYIRPDMVEKMVLCTDDGQMDCVLCGLTVDNGLKLVDTPWYENSFALDNKEIMYEYLTSKKIVTGPVCKLISRDVMKNIRFPAFRANEDEYIMHEILGACSKVYILNAHLYVQLLRDGSTERTGFNENKMHLLDCGYALKAYVKDKYPDYLIYVNDLPAKYCVLLLRRLYNSENGNRFSECEIKLKNILETEINCLDKKSDCYNEAYAYLYDFGRYKRMIRKIRLKNKCRKILKTIAVKLKR